MKIKLILEMGCNHQGSIDIAREMIYLADKLGAWGVKFQKRDIESFPELLKRKKRDLKNSFGSNYYEHRKALEFSPLQVAELKETAIKTGLAFLCSAFDEKSVDDLVGIDCDYIKLPSQLYSDKRLQKKLLNLQPESGFSIVVSTGMHTEDEIFTNPWVYKANILMHCISVYPIPRDSYLSMCTLLKMQREREGLPCGYSSHSPAGEDIIKAVLCGAEYIERHFTLDKNMKGSDHGTVSSDYKEILEIKKDIESAERVLGEGRGLSAEEETVKKIYRG